MVYCANDDNRVCYAYIMILYIIYVNNKKVYIK